MAPRRLARPRKRELAKFGTGFKAVKFVYYSQFPLMANIESVL